MKKNTKKIAPRCSVRSLKFFASIEPQALKMSALVKNVSFTKLLYGKMAGMLSYVFQSICQK